MGTMLVLLILSQGIRPGYADENRSFQLNLTEEEQAFIEEHPVIRVSNEMDWPPFDFAVGGQPLGLSIDLMEMLGDRLGIEFEYVNGYRWNELLEMFKEKKLDILQSAYKTESRKKFGLFTKPYYKDKTVFIVSRHSPGISDINDLNGKIIAAPKGWAYESYLVKHHPGINILTVNNMEEAFRAVKKGRADAAIELSAVARYLIKKNFLEGLKISGWFKEYDRNEHRSLHILVRKDWPVLHGMLGKALKTITPGDISSLEQKWLGAELASSETTLNLTHEEETFLETHPELRVANELDWPPFDFVKNGEPAGFAIDYVKLLGEKIGVELDFVNGYTWSELLEKGRKKEVDIFPGLWKSPEREEYLSFTQSYIELIKVLVTRKDLAGVESLDDMKELPIALPEGYTLTNIIMKEHPDYTYILVDNPKEGLKAVSLGRADGFIGSLGIINYLIKKHFIDNIKVVSEVQLDEALPLYMAVRKDWSVLSGILNKAMESVTSREYDRIVSKWIGSIDTSGDLTNLTNKEQAYLEQKDQISMCVRSDFEPYESLDPNGEYQGIIADFYNLMSRKIGLPIEVVGQESDEDAMECLESGKCDIVSTVQPKDLGADAVKATPPYIQYPLVIATDSKAIYINSIENIPEKKIGICRHAYFSEEIRKRYPQIRFVPVENPEKGLSMVQKGELFGLVDTAPKIGYYIQNNEMVDLKISGELPYQVEFRTGIRKDDEILYTVFEKAVNSLTSEEKKSTFQNWMTIKYEQGFDYSLLWKILLGIGFVGLLAVYRHISVAQYNRKLAGLNEELTKANEKLETISYIDGLTGVPNRRKFDSVLKSEWRRCGRSRQFLTIIMLDIDYFKRFNDRYGHLEGDDCLKRVARTISEIPGRAGDFVGRYGGEEFAVILPGTGETGARQVAEKILSRIHSMKIANEDSEVSPYLTVSLGVVTAVPGQGISSKDFVDTADQLLYKAKDAGRNQFMMEQL